MAHPIRPQPLFPGTSSSGSEGSKTATPVAAPPPLPDVEDLTDCESDIEEYTNETSITRPTKAFFLGVRHSAIYTPRDLEEGRVISRSESLDTLVSSTRSSEPRKEKAKTLANPLIPEVDPILYHGLDSSPLPPKKGSRIYRYLRWNFGSVYRRIFCLAFLANVATLVFLITKSVLTGNNQLLTYQQAGIAVTANILAAMIVRNEHVVNAMFWVFGTWSKGLPFWARRLVAKVYSYGGIHSGGAVAATFWFIAFLALLTVDFHNSEVSVVRSYIYLVSYGILFLLITMLIFAHPRVRVVMHNWFEGIHRFMGWTAILLFWAQTILLTLDSSSRSNNNTNNNTASFWRALLASPDFWMLVVITLLVVYPWTRMRLRDVEAEVLSDHCVKLNFNYRDVHYGQAIRLTDAPLKETHAFGVVPFPAAPRPMIATHCPGCRCHSPMAERPPRRRGSEEMSVMEMKAHAQAYSSTKTPELSHAGERGFSVFVSNAGDWTKKIIQNPPKKIYTRGTPQFGVLRVAGLFAPCLVVATGSGIAPCLSLFVQKPDHPVRIIWSAPSPLETYGRALVDLLYKTDPNAIIIDTRKTGRPDLVKIAYRVWEGNNNNNNNNTRREKKCEAVVIISNQKVTKKVVYGLESRGVPAYGAIFDS